jgi:hypothetical protein
MTNSLSNIIHYCKGTSVCFLTSPLLFYYPPQLPLFICISPHLCNASVPSPGTIPKANDFHTRRSNDSPEVNSPNVVDFRPPPLLIPQEHWMSLGHIGTGLCDTTTSSTITWIPIYGRLGIGRLGTVILSISFVV